MGQDHSNLCAMVKQVLRIAAAAVLEDNPKKAVTFWIHRIDIETCSTKKVTNEAKLSAFMPL